MVPLPATNVEKAYPCFAFSVWWPISLAASNNALFACICMLTCASPTSKLLISQISPTLVPVGPEQKGSVPDPLSSRVHTVSDNGLTTRVWLRETRGGGEFDYKILMWGG